jgi:hypothetical protein
MSYSIGLVEEITSLLIEESKRPDSELFRIHEESSTHD